MLPKEESSMESVKVSVFDHLCEISCSVATREPCPCERMKSCPSRQRMPMLKLKQEEEPKVAIQMRPLERPQMQKPQTMAQMEGLWMS